MIFQVSLQVQVTLGCNFGQWDVVKSFWVGLLGKQFNRKRFNRYLFFVFGLQVLPFFPTRMYMPKLEVKQTYCSHVVHSYMFQIERIWLIISCAVIITYFHLILNSLYIRGKKERIFKSVNHYCRIFWYEHFLSCFPFSS